MRFLFWVIVAVAAIALVLFAVSNRGDASLSFWPLPFIAEVPLYLLIVVTFVFGFIAGRLFGFVAARGRRGELRRRARRIEDLERELAATQGVTQTPPARLPVPG